MKEFILVFMGGEPGNPQDLPKHYAAYGEFMKFLNSGNHFKNGIPADSSAGRMVSAKSIEKSGDFMSVQNRVGGVMVIYANDLDQAADIAKQNPIVKNGGRVLVFPVKEM